MKKKAKKQVKTQDAMYYRWEFLRRWSKYQNDYANYKKKKKFPPDYWRKKYEIIDPVDPSTAYGFCSRALLVPDPAVVVVDFECRPMGYRDSLLEDRVETDLIVNKVDMTTIDSFTVKINLRQRQERILKDFKKQLKVWRTACGVTQDKRIQYKLYDRYLQIYDLRNNKKTLLEIAKIVDKKDYKKIEKTYHNKYDFDPLKEKIKRNIKACSKLIQGGYKIIS